MPDHVKRRLVATLAACSLPPAARILERRCAAPQRSQRYTSFRATSHLQNVLLHGELVESNARLVLRGGEREIPHPDRRQGKWRLRRSAPEHRYWTARSRRSACACIHGPARSGALASSGRGAGPERLECHRSAAGDDGFCPRARAPAVAVRGAERHHRRRIPRRNLFGDQPSAPGKSRYDFVLRSADAAVWVTDLRPRGRGFRSVGRGAWIPADGCR